MRNKYNLWNDNPFFSSEYTQDMAERSWIQRLGRSPATADDYGSEPLPKSSPEVSLQTMLTTVDVKLVQ